MADDILKNIPLPADLPENWTSEQTVAPTGAEVGMDEQHGYNYLMRQVNNAQKAAKAIAAALLNYVYPVGSLYISENSTSPAELFGGTWERIEDCTIWGASDTHPAGTVLAAGLPNIDGNSSVAVWATDVAPSGPYYRSSVLNGAAYVSDGKTNTIYFDASRSNHIYGASDTVQPPAYCLYIWRRVS